MKLRCFQVDAFTSRQFAGNPAGVVPLASWIDDELMQSIAAENNVAETAFFVPASAHPDADYELRWFTPAQEVDLCGHATLASAHVLYQHLGYDREAISFRSQSGILKVGRDGGLYQLDFPARPPVPLEDTSLIQPALGCGKMEAYSSTRDLLVVLDSIEELTALTPDMEATARHWSGVIVTARGESGFDFISRFFAPALGVSEDPVTGSAHCVLIPFWSDRLGKTTLRAYQASKRGGELQCRFLATEGRVLIGGSAVTYLDGVIFV